MAYAIMRVEKLKSFGNIGGVGSHHFRTRETKNANTEKTPDNINLIECKNNDLVEAVKNRIGSIKMRKNGVLAVEVLLTASPDFFRENVSAHGEYDKEKVSNFNEHAIKYLKTEYGANNVVSAICHLDEATPHIQAVIVPIDYEKSSKGKLNAAKWLDGRKLLSEMQDRFAEAMIPTGLERGMRGSESTHTTIKEFYGTLESSDILKIPEANIGKPPLLGKESWAKDESERINELQRPTIQPIQSKAATSAIATKKMKQAQATAKKYAEELERMKKQAKLVRDIDLELILEQAGATRVNRKGVWDYNGQQIKITGNKFYNHYRNEGGGGAIDLVMHLENYDYAQAVKLLSDEYGNGEAIGAAMHSSKVNAKNIIKNTPSPLPAPVREHWPRARNYLVNIRGLCATYIDKLYEKGTVYADFNENACFRYGSKGVEKRGTRGKKWRGFAGPKEAGFKLISKKNNDSVVFVESAIDALSFFDLKQNNSEFEKYKGFDVIAVGGLSSSILIKLSENYKNTIIGFDKEEEAEEAIRRINKTLPNNNFERLTPENGHKDWNDYVSPQSSDDRDQKESFENNNKKGMS